MMVKVVRKGHAVAFLRVSGQPVTLTVGGEPEEARRVLVLLLQKLDAKP